MQIENKLPARLLDLSNVALVPDVKFTLPFDGKLKKFRRNVVVISTQGLEEKEFWSRYYSDLRDSTVSFPLKERAKHLMVRIDNRVYNFGRIVINLIPRFRTRKLQIPMTNRLEVVLQLSGLEMQNLKTYLSNIKKNRGKVIGKFTMEGHQYTKGGIEDNRTLVGGHNCTSWIGLAPIGEQGQSLLELLGAQRDWQVATNPGWWTNWLAATATEQRVPYVLYWTNQPLGQAVEKIRVAFDWDFNRH